MKILPIVILFFSVQTFAAVGTTYSISVLCDDAGPIYSGILTLPADSDLTTSYPDPNRGPLSFGQYKKPVTLTFGSMNFEASLSKAWQAVELGGEKCASLNKIQDVRVLYWMGGLPLGSEPKAIESHTNRAESFDLSSDGTAYSGHLGRCSFKTN